MNKTEFLQLLKENNIDESCVVFEDSIRDGYCIRKNHFRWEVFYRERGNEYNVLGFPSESDALIYLYKELCGVHKYKRMASRS